MNEPSLFPIGKGGQDKTANDQGVFAESLVVARQQWDGAIRRRLTKMTWKRRNTEPFAINDGSQWQVPSSTNCPLAAIAPSDFPQAMML